MNEDDRRPKVFFSPTSHEVRIFGFTIRTATKVRILGALFTFMGLFWLVDSKFWEELFGWWKVVLGILFVGLGILLLLVRVVDPKDT